MLLEHPSSADFGERDLITKVELDAMSGRYFGTLLAPGLEVVGLVMVDFGDCVSTKLDCC